MAVWMCVYVYIRVQYPSFLINLRHVHLWPYGHVTMFKSHHKSKWHMEIQLYVEVHGVVWECLHLDLRSILIYINPWKIWMHENVSRCTYSREIIQLIDSMTMWLCGQMIMFKSHHSSYRMRTCDHVVMWLCLNLAMYENDTWRSIYRQKLRAELCENAYTLIWNYL